MTGEGEGNSKKGELVLNKMEKQILGMKAQMADMEIELSVLPALKKQLKEKNKEIEVVNMYVREVEICQKIRAPLPNFTKYKE